MPAPEPRGGGCAPCGGRSSLRRSRLHSSSCPELVSSCGVLPVSLDWIWVSPPATCRSLVFRCPGTNGSLGAEVHRPRWTLPRPMDFVGPEYFDAIGLPILRGRGFTDADREGSPNVAVVTQTIANRFWPGEDPIGKQVRQAAGSPVITVVGLVGDFHFREHRQATP